MNDKGVLYLTITFVVAEGINVWSSWINPPFSGLGDIPYATLRKGESAAALTVAGYGLFASVVTKNLLPLVIAILFNFLMYWVYEREFIEDKESHNYGY